MSGRSSRKSTISSCKKTTMKTLFLLCLVVGFSTSTLVTAHESCCKHKLKPQQEVSEFVIDHTDVAPDEFKGEPRWMVDPEDERPEEWDDEDDGEWEPNLILNPKYKWKPRMIRNPNYAPPPTYWEKLQIEIRAAIPWVTLGVLATGFLTTISLPLDTLRVHLLSNNPMSLIQAAVLGLATPLCSCGALPIAAGLVSRGVPLASALVFLTASQSAGLDSAAITWGLLGPMAVLCRLGGAIILAVAAGMACGVKFQESAKDSSTSCCSTTNTSSSTISSGLTLLTTLLETAVEVMPTVLTGLSISTAALHFLPSLIRFDDTADSSTFVVRLGILASAVPLQLCEHTSVTLAAAIQKAGGSPGLAFAFLLSAPATNMPSLLLLLQHGDTGMVIRVVTALCASALFLSYAVDIIGVDLLVGKDPGDMVDLPSWYTAASPWIAGILLLGGVLHRLYPKVFVLHLPSSTSCCESSMEKAKME